MNITHWSKGDKVRWVPQLRLHGKWAQVAAIHLIKDDGGCGRHVCLIPLVHLVTVWLFSVEKQALPLAHVRASDFCYFSPLCEYIFSICLATAHGMTSSRVINSSCLSKQVRSVKSLRVKFQLVWQNLSSEFNKHKSSVVTHFMPWMDPNFVSVIGKKKLCEHNQFYQRREWKRPISTRSYVTVSTSDHNTYSHIYTDNIVLLNQVGFYIIYLQQSLSGLLRSTVLHCSELGKGSESQSVTSQVHFTLRIKTIWCSIDAQQQEPWPLLFS